MPMSAKHGLVEPNRRLRPYDLALGQIRSEQRREWGEGVAASLEEHYGSLRGAVFQVHAGAPYRRAIVPPLSVIGASITAPLERLPLGAQLQWYTNQPQTLRRRTATTVEVRRALRDLDGAPERIAASDWPGPVVGLDQPGLYSWWVDGAGAKELTGGLGHRIPPGRIYAGQTGATKWPSGRTSTATLGSRIRGNHLGGSISSSTFRQTLAAVLATPLELVVTAPLKIERESEQRLSKWIRAHLQVAVHSVQERDPLKDLEERVLECLDPPLNLEGMRLTPTRATLSGLRGQLRPA